MFKQYKGNYIVIGPPGTGKTTFLVSRAERAQRCSDSVLVCSLTKAAEREFASRNVSLPAESIGTLHAHAYRAIGRPQVIRQSDLSDWNDRHPAWKLSDLKDDYDLGPKAETPGDRLLRQFDLARHRQQDVMKMSCSAFGQEWTEWKEQADVIDFTDMIGIAARDTSQAPGAPSVILADEAQDLSRLEYELLQKWSRYAVATITVGDPDQALYVWRGADPDTFKDASVPDDHRGVLSQSYRVPRAVHALATRWVSQIPGRLRAEYEPRDADGEVRHIDTSWKDPTAAIDQAEQHIAEGRSVMILSSANYLLVPTLAVLRKRALPYANPWRTYRHDWNPLLTGSEKRISACDRVRSYLRPTSGAQVPVHRDGACSYCANTRRSYDGGPCRQCCTGYLDQTWTRADFGRLVEIVTAKGVIKHGRKKQLEKDLTDGKAVHLLYGDLLEYCEPDAAEWLWTMAQGKRTITEAVEWLLPRLLAGRQRGIKYAAQVAAAHGLDALTKAPRLYIGTIHSFKGGEADVVIVYPDIPFAAYKASQDSQAGCDSVARVFYVGVTRARETLLIARPTSSLSVEL